MVVVRGDLIRLAVDGAFDVIVHGCNCFGSMGAGIARAIAAEFPEAAAADRETAAGDRAKLGTITTATVRRGAHVITVVNGYTQYRYHGAGRLVDYEAVRAVMREVKRRFAGRRIGYPKIGAGLARGDWDAIAAIIDEELAGEDHTLVEFAAE
jgi:O-acetyl-ADP-ribose deacetylase (regulator of RNase III)